MKPLTKTCSKLTLVISAISTLGLTIVANAPSADAFTLNGNSVTGITSQDIGKSFDINFDGNVATQNVAGLKSKATFTLSSFSGSKAIWNINLSNISDGGITSRTSALGFDVSALLSSGSSSDLFSKVHLDGAFPNQFGNIDICFTNGNNCQGGQNGGVSTGQTGTLIATLNFANAVSSFDLSNFGVRYQSITGTALGTSGTGRGTTVSDQTKDVPEPMTIVGSVMALGFGSVFQKRRGKTQQKAA